MNRSPLVFLLMLPALACSGAPDLASARPIPAYDEHTGKLTRLSADRDGDGRLDTWAEMDGLQTVRIEIDRSGDGAPDRWEFYEPSPQGGAMPSRIARAEERLAPGGPVSRREVYRDGALSTVEEDTDGDGRMDKWERYAAGTLAQLELDTVGKGYPSRRLIYQAGVVVRVELDPDGDGAFVPAGDAR